MSASRVVPIGLAVLLAGPSVSRGQSAPITEQDLLSLRWIADPRISPDGRQVAYVLVTVNQKEDRYETSLWLVGTDSGAVPRRLTDGPQDLAPRWSPASDAIAFLRAAERQPAQLWLLPMSGGEPRQLTRLGRGASPAAWSPDGRALAFASTTAPGDSADSAAKKSDVRVITRAEYRANGGGFLDPGHPSHIWRLDLRTPAGDSAAQPRKLTEGPFDENDPLWGRDGSSIYFASDRVVEPYYVAPDADLYAVPAAGGTPTRVIDISGTVAQAAPASDGARWAFVGALNPPRVPSYLQSEVFLFDDGRAASLTDGYDYEIGNDLATDQHPPRGGGGSPVVWAADGRSLIVSTTEEGRCNLVRIEIATRRVTPLTTGDHEVVGYSATLDGSRLAVTIGDPTHPAELYLLEAGTGRLTRLTHENDTLVAGRRLSQPETIWYRSFDGRRIEAWVLKPPGFTAGTRYPLILNIHGGPHSAYGYSFFHELQLMAARGYVVLAPNPRGSTSYGREFANIIQYRYPGDDYRDLMAGVDELVRRGYADERRLGVTGGSGGGLLTNWIITRTGRFHAAVSQRSIADWSTFWYTADFALFRPFWFRNAPFRDPEEFEKRSPISYVDRVHTPLMLIEGEDDLRTPPAAGGEMMFRALKALRRPVVMVTFPGENHELSRAGKPSHRLERLRHILNWFDKYLRGKPITLYDLPTEQP
jgi:dipeptidyl aminopeptidase/acylaminoacyl peptidase